MEADMSENFVLLLVATVLLAMGGIVSIVITLLRGGSFQGGMKIRPDGVAAEVKASSSAAVPERQIAPKKKTA